MPPNCCHIYHFFQPWTQCSLNSAGDKSTEYAPGETRWRHLHEKVRGPRAPREKTGCSLALSSVLGSPVPSHPGVAATVSAERGNPFSPIRGAEVPRARRKPHCLSALCSLLLLCHRSGQFQDVHFRAGQTKPQLSGWRTRRGTRGRLAALGGGAAEEEELGHLHEVV